MIIKLGKRVLDNIKMEELEGMLFNELADEVMVVESLRDVAALYAEDVFLREGRMESEPVLRKEDTAALSDAYGKAFDFVERGVGVLAVYKAFIKIAPNSDKILQRQFSNHQEYFEGLRQDVLRIRQEMLADLKENWEGEGKK